MGDLEKAEQLKTTKSLRGNAKGLITRTDQTLRALLEKTDVTKPELVESRKKLLDYEERFIECCFTIEELVKDDGVLLQNEIDF